MREKGPQQVFLSCAVPRGVLGMYRAILIKGNKTDALSGDALGGRGSPVLKAKGGSEGWEFSGWLCNPID